MITVRRYDVVERGDEHAVVESRSLHPAAAHRVHCRMLAGHWALIPGLFGVAGAVTEPRCTARGDDRCRLVVRWDRPAPVTEERRTRSRRRVDELVGRFEAMQAMAAELATIDDLGAALERIIDRAGAAMLASRFLVTVRPHDDSVPSVYSAHLDPDTAQRAAESLWALGPPRPPVRRGRPARRRRVPAPAARPRPRRSRRGRRAAGARRAPRPVLRRRRGALRVRERRHRLLPGPRRRLRHPVRPGRRGDVRREGRRSEPVRRARRRHRRTPQQAEARERAGALLDELGLDPELVELEITDRIVMSDEDLPASVAGLRDLGVRLAVDDFGTGSSVLSRLHHCPVDVLKIDRTFIEPFSYPDPDTRLVDGLVSMAHALDLEVVIEGVEDAAQADAVRRVGPELAQGFHFHGPMPAEELTALLVGRALRARPPAEVVPLRGGRARRARR